MELSPEERKRIYEEEKARIEAREQIEREKRRIPETTSIGLLVRAVRLIVNVVSGTAGYPKGA